MDTSTLTDFTEDPSTTFDLYTNDLNSQELIPEEPVTFSDYVIDAVTITNSTEEESGECTDIVDGFFLIFVIVSVRILLSDGFSYFSFGFILGDTRDVCKVA